MEEKKTKRGIRRVYLILYNTVLFIAFLICNVSLFRRSLTGTLDKNNLADTAHVIKLLTYTQLLEVVHPLFDLVPGGSILPLMQVTGRMVANGFMADPEISENSAPFVKYTLMVWSTIELFRYSFYALRLIGIDIYPITWCRYTLFLPLYPMGGFCESQVLLEAAKHLDRTGAMSLNLPNPANFSFHTPSVLRLHTYVLLGPAVLHLMRHMWSQRKKQLKTKTA